MKDSMIVRRLPALLAGALVLGAIASCDDPTRPPADAEITPRIQLVRADSATIASLVLPLTEVRVRTFGPTGRVVPLVLESNIWRGTVSGLAPGDYEMVIEGIADGQVQYYGRLPNITLARGQRAQPVVLFMPAVPVVANPPLQNTTNFSQRVPFAAIPSASGYVVQISQSGTFASGVTEFTAADTNPLVNVTQPGTWFIRSRAILPQVPTSSIPWSEIRSWVVVQATGGDNAGAATPVTTPQGTPQSIGARNITPTKRFDWFSYALRAGDTLIVETRAARLTLASQLNTTLTLFSADATTQLAENLDIAGSTDSRLVFVPTSNGVHMLRVSGASNTSGHYELTAELRRLPAAPTGLSATIVSNSQVNLAWSDNADNEESYRVERCDGLTCTNFVEVASTAASATGAQQTALAQGTTYRWRVRSRNAIGNSVVYSNIVSAAMLAPAAPTNLVVSTLGPTSLRLQWQDNSNNEESFRIERCAGTACTNFELVTSAAADSTSIVDNSAAVDQQYLYRVLASNAVAPSAPTATVAANTLRPGTPSVLAATTVPSAIRLSWTVGTPTGVETQIERCVGVDCIDFTARAVGAGNLSGFDDSTVVANTTYRYRVRATNIAGASAYAAVATANTNLAASPSGLTATTLATTRVGLAWTDNANNETGFTVSRCSGAACTNFVVLNTAAANATTAVDSTAVEGNLYRYVVRADAPFAPSANSAAASASTALPAVPTAFTATTLSNSSIRVQWTDNANNETGFVLERCSGSGCTSFVGTDTVPADSTGRTQTGLATGTLFRYRLKSINAAGSSAYTAIAQASTNLPAAPTSIRVLPVTSTSASISWTDVATDETGYRLERCLGVACTGFSTLINLPAGAVNHVDATVLADSSYNYRVSAFNAAGSSATIGPVQVTLAAPRPASFATAVAQSGTRIVVAWADSSTNESAFRVERCTGDTCINFTSLASVGPDTLTLTDTTVSANNFYRYRVVALNALGEAAASDAVLANTFSPGVPTGLAATATSATTVSLTWNDNGNFETTYQLERCVGAGCSNFVLHKTLDANTVAYTDSALVNLQTYRYRVRSVNAIATSAYSSIAEALTEIPPEPTFAAAVSQTATSIRVSWVDNSGNEELFLVQRCAGLNCTAFADLPPRAANSTSFVDGGLTAGTYYSYRVQAAKAGVTPSPFSNVASTGTFAPLAPTTLQAVLISGTQIDLNWVDNASFELRQDILRCSGLGCTPVVIDSVGANVLTYSDQSVTTGNTYTYRVRARNNIGTSAPSNDVTLNTILPAAPASLAATAASASQVNLGWVDNANNESGFRIERCTGAGCSNFTLRASVDPNGVAYSDQGLTLGEVYTYRIYAFNVAGPSATVGPAVAALLLPTAPTGLATATASPTQVTLNWTDAATNESGFRVERCTGFVCANFVEVGTTATDSGRFVDAVASNTFYNYRVRAFNASGNSAFTSTVAANTFTPAEPTTLSATTNTATLIDLAWVDNATNELGYIVERCLGSSCTVYTPIDTTDLNAASFADSTVAATQVYKYQVRGYNGVGSSVYTNVAQANTTVPATPTGFSGAVNGQTAVNLSWTDVATTESGYRVERCAGVNCTNFVTLTTTAANANTFSDVAALADTRYRYRVAAVGNGRSGFTQILAFSTFLPVTPSTFAAAAVSDIRADLSWTDASDDEQGFKVERCAGANCVNFAVLVTLDSNVTSYSDISAVTGTTYRYRVYSFNGAGNSLLSSVQTVVTNVPRLPTLLAAATEASGTAIGLTWLDNASDETGYEIDRCTGVACTNFVLLATAAAGAQAYSDASVAASTSYRYRVRAVNAGGSSGYTNLAIGSTVTPGTPTAFTALAATAARVDLAWTDNAINETGFRIERCTGAACVNYALLANVPAGTQAYQDATAAQPNTYRYQVRAENAATSSAFSGTVAVRVDVPDAPITLAATTISTTRINLAWDLTALDATSQRLERCLGISCTNFALLASVATNIEQFTDSTVAASTLYRYRVLALNGVGTSLPSNLVVGSTDIAVTPTALTATVTSPSSVTLAWTLGSTNADSVLISRCLGAACVNFTQTRAVAGNATSAVDGSVVVGNIYRYRIAAKNAVGTSLPSDPVAVSTELPQGAIVRSVVPASATSITVKWLAGLRTTNVEVRRCIFNGPCAYQSLATVPVAPDSLVDTGLVPDTRYVYQVIARNASGASDTSSGIQVQMARPTVPATVAATINSATQITVTWVDGGNNEATYRVERCAGPGCTPSGTHATLARNTEVFVDGSLTTGQSYTYRIVGINGAGESDPTLSVARSLTLPATPSTLTATLISPTRIDLAWTDNATDELGYLVERCDGDPCEYTQIASRAANTTSGSDLTISLNQTYRYRVRAFNNVGTSSYSPVGQANTFIPAIPTVLISTAITGQRVDLAWTDASNNESGFRVERCAGAGCTTYDLVANLGAGVTTYSNNSGVAFGTSYTYRVRAFNTAGTSNPSNISVASTVLNAPTGLLVATTSRTTAELSWQDNSTIETAYLVERCAGEACVPVSQVAAPAGTNTAGTFTFSNTSLAAATDYTWRVRASTAGGVSGYSGNASARTPISFILNTSPLALASITDAAQGMRHYVTSVAAGTPAIRFRISGGGGDADLYTRAGQSPRLNQTDWDCRPYVGGNAETCYHVSPAAGDWYAMLHGFNAYTGVSLEARSGSYVGYGTALGSQSQWNSGFLLAQSFTASTTGSLSHLGLQFGTAVGTNARIGIYSSRFNLALQQEPGNLLGTAVITQGASGARTVQLPAEVSVVAGTVYWIAILFETPVFVNSLASSSETWVYFSQPYATGMPATFPTSGTNRSTFTRQNLFGIVF